LADIARQIPDLITVDIELPGMDGFDLAGHLAESPGTRDIPILAVSVSFDESGGLRFGISALPKSLDQQQLLQAVARSLADSAKQRVLVVEDDPSTRELLSAALGKRQFEVLTAGDGKRGLAMAREERPGLILLDLRLPSMDGFEVLQVLKRDPETAAIPVIAMTGSEGLKVGARARVLALGAADFVTKPFDLDMLIQEIQIFIQQEASPQ
jgi:CheY-like chemotaxis protein